MRNRTLNLFKITLQELERRASNDHTEKIHAFEILCDTLRRRRFLKIQYYDILLAVVTSDDARLHPMFSRNEDSDFEVEQELPSLSDFIPKEELKKLKPKEHKCQQTINGE